MLGAIIGDIVGSRFERHNHRSKEFAFLANNCRATDDSVMSIAIAKAIMRCGGDYDSLGALAVKYMRELGRQYPNSGYGKGFKAWLFAEMPEPYNSFGNGAAMRVSPCGFAARSEEEAVRLSLAVTEVTHNHPEGIKGAEATAIAVFMARCGATKQEIRQRIERDYYPLDFTIDGIRDTYEFSVTCQETVPQAITAFLESVSFEDAIRNAISIGGDSDTLAAITGSIAEAYYGIDKEFENAVVRFLDNELRGIYKDWKKFARTIYIPQKFAILTKYIGKLDDSESLMNFIGDFYCFSKAHDEHTLAEYADTLKKNGIKWTEKSMREADAEKLGETAVLALITGVFRANHFASGVADAFNRDGILTKWLERLKCIDDLRPPEPECHEVTAFRIEMRHAIYRESVEVTTHALAITEHLGDFGDITHRYEYKEGFIADAALYILEQARVALASDGWLDTDNTVESENHSYKLIAFYDNGDEATHRGFYNRVHIPERPWVNLMGAILSFVKMFTFGKTIQLTDFLSAMRPGEVKYCGVEFSKNGKIYHYRTTDNRITVGDTVIVPVGRDNDEQVATIITIEFCRWDNTPYPLEKTKEIIRKADGSAMPNTTLRLIDCVNAGDRLE